MTKKVLLVAALIATAFTGANAQITAGRIGSGPYTDYSGQTTTVTGIDLNNDGAVDFKIGTAYEMVDPYREIENGSLEFKWQGSGYVSLTNIVVMGSTEDGWDKIKNLPANTTVDASSNWNSQGDAYVQLGSGNAQNVGLRVYVNGNTYYGYATVTVSGTTCTWNSVYFNATPNAAIRVGQTSGGGDGIENATGSNFKVFANGKTIRIWDLENTEVQVYDMGGRLVASEKTADNCTVNVPEAGVYVVRANGVSRKVVAF